MQARNRGSGRSAGAAHPGLPPADAVLGAIARSVIVTDHRGVVTRLWNRRAEDLYGWSATEAIGRPITALLMPEATPAEAVAMTGWRFL